ncbi:MAG TPA: exodeoxyribonuclease V subunit alpha [Quisquiliibacterium sp.]|nr:exodeoxyribonuclease V subunit alpha [Quisquiliibacterium sp.]HQN13905.1 exodeoxyribonuclease V subunit alpha [Quisquiliibacterium sp.]
MSDLERRAALAVEAEFAALLARYHQRLGGAGETAAAVGEAGVRAWRASAEGHVCVAVDAAAAALLERSPVVCDAGACGAGRAHACGPDGDGRAGAPPDRPLVLQDGHLYLHRMWQAEDALACGLADLDASAPFADDAARRAEVDRLCADGGVDAEQRALIETALARRLTIVSGGPGTGKTTTLARLIVAAAHLAPGLRIAIAAPTGRAAARLSDSLLAQLPKLDPDPALRRRLPQAGTTLHRLLGVRGAAGRAHGPGRSGAAGARVLDADLVIVDEASMLDLDLARRLVASIGPGSRLVLCGDKDQLASVEAGAVFAAVSSLRGPAGALRDAVVLLERNYRQRAAPGIAALAARMRDGALAADVSVPPSPDLEFRASTGADRVIEDALTGYSEALDAAAAGAPGATLLAACARFRIVAALRSGPLGADALNEAIGARIRRQLGVDPAAAWFAGRQVTVAQNAPALGLFNGDLGVCLVVDGRLAVAFPAEDGVRLFAPIQLPAVRDAWVSTVHAAQGSEFDTVGFVPAPSGHPLATRELVYTAVTRARARLVVYGTVRQLADAAGHPVRRLSLLAERIARRARARSDPPT